MSIINQVLNELENRGVNTPLGETTIRPVPPRRQSHHALYLTLGIGLLVVLAGGKWYLSRTQAIAPAKLVVAPPVVALAVPAPASEPASAPVWAVSMPGESGVQVVSSLAASQPVDSLRGKPLLQISSEDEPEAAPAEAKKPAPRKPERAKPAPAETVDVHPAENPELLKKISPLQRAENEFRIANLAVQEGRTEDALTGYKGALLIDSTYKPARRAWVALLVNLKRNAEAEEVLQRGLKRDARDTSFAMQLARLQVERDAAPLALETLQKVSQYAEGQADFQSFMAYLLHRQNRYEEAVAHYQIALKLAPNNGVWLMGMGISLQALERKEDAREAFQRALATNTLNPQLQAFVQQKLKEL
ncbi:MAG: tetratricopeptide repeat protein [Sideroxyarcus sp.]|nr:tetratricopeptide repeat protein [Sideroxyarcus sp.]